MTTMRQVLFTANQEASLQLVPALGGPLSPFNIRGKTLVSLTSPGTELNWGYLGNNFPVTTGYANVLEVLEVGSSVSKFQPGDIVFGAGGHAEVVEVGESDAVLVPAGLQPEVAVFSRLMGVSMSTLNTAAAHPPANVLVTGLGPVGNLAAQIFARCGYSVTAVDPVAARRQTGLDCGLKDVRGNAKEACQDLEGKVALHLECSGHEQAVLAGCKLVCNRGEVVLVGVPWTRRADMQAFELLHAIFHRYVVLRSGWEWEVPKESRAFAFNSISGNIAAAMAWLKEGSINVAPLGTTYHPTDCQKVYAGLHDQSLPTPAAIFDWRSK